ncbi:hypothetical protein CPC08DRAFT_181324 [Agrocybe pediades]|nr:hypothetical protein CPC08DRAFT_181324 [Agrocybe pediades]
MSLGILRRYPILCSTQLISSPHRCYSSSTKANTTDDYGIPLRPTWSVNELLSSYPTPKLSNATLDRLYELSALLPPKETKEYDSVKENLEEMIRLVEAVRLVDTSGVIPAGRGEKEDADRVLSEVAEGGERGQELLKHATNTKDGFYLVDAERKR